ncbi:hypothetical protein GCM10027589_27750 [Actinocorallia lasiicapitis]
MLPLVLAVALAAAPVTPHWETVGRTDLRGDDFLGAITFGGKNSGWAFGTRMVQKGERSVETIAYRWNGRRWTRSPLPAGLEADWEYYDQDKLSASSPANAWAAALPFNSAGARVLRWRGGRWTISKIPTKGQVVAVGAYGKDRAIAFASGRRTWIFQHGRWKAGARLMFPVEHVRSDGKNVWVHTRIDRKLAVARWNGKSWKLLPSTGITDTYPNDWGDLAPVPGGVIISGSDGKRTFFLRWDGRRWIPDTTPAISGWAMRCVVPDGKGGLWAGSVGADPMGDDSPATLWHRARSGAWTATTLGDRTRIALPDACAARPGTSEIWAATGDSDHGWDPDGVFQRLVTR